MPKTITVPEHSYVVYTFDELDEKAQEKAIEWFATDYPDYEWYESTYEDALRIGLKITSFDTDRGSYVKGDFTKSAYDVAACIKIEHGKDCDSFKTADAFLNDLAALETKYDIANKDEYEDDLTEFNDAKEELENEFKKSLCEDYLKMLRDEYEYITSREHIIESITINEYTFDETGKRKD